MPKGRKEKHPSEYLNDQEEWQQHQYDPGHYLGGNLPPQIKYSLGTRGGKYLGILFLGFGIVSAIVGILPIIKGSGTDLLGLVLSIILVLAGLRLITLKKQRS